jgi:hypothetical protein
MQKKNLCFIVLLCLFSNISGLSFIKPNTQSIVSGEPVKSGTATPLPLLNYEWMVSEENIYGELLAIDSQDNIFVSATTDERESVILKYDSEGTLLWSDTWGFFNNSWGNPEVSGMIVDAFDNLYIAGEVINNTDPYFPAHSEVFVKKYDPEGHVEWYKEVGDNQRGYNHAEGIALDRYGRIIICGWTFRFNYPNQIDFYKFHSISGALLWSKSWGLSYDSLAEGMVLDENDNIYVIGRKFEPNYTEHLFKFDSNANQLWNITVNDQLIDIAVDHEHNLYTLSWINGFVEDNYLSGCLTKYNPLGIKIWERINVPSLKISIDNDNYIYLPGYRYSMMKFDKTGTSLWNTTKTGEFFTERSRDIAVDSLQNVYYVGSATDFRENSYCILVKHDNLPEYSIEPKFMKCRNLYALIIGIENYAGTGNDLDYCVDDAECIEAFIKSCGVSPSTIFTLFDGQATRENINARFEQIKSEITPEDGFLMFYSGHGDDDVFFPYDLSEYRYQTLGTHFSQINCSEKILLLDACRSGSATEYIKGDDVYIMTACLSIQDSIETYLLHHGIFTYFFDQSCKLSNDTDHDGIISLEEQFPFVRSEVDSYAAHTFYEYQFPKEVDLNQGPTVLYQGLRSVGLSYDGNKIDYQFFIEGFGQIYYCNLTLRQNSVFKSFDISSSNTTQAGFGLYKGTIKINDNNKISLELEIGIKGEFLRKFTYVITLMPQFISFGPYYLILTIITLLAISLVVRRKLSKN